MALGIRYKSEFYGKDGIVWRAEILQDGYGGTEPVEFDVPEESPLTIEWPERDKLEPLQCSNATLKLISNSDRQFIDLYSVDVGEIRLDVYRAGVLYWSGVLDTELYEEPYSTQNGYEVMLTFSDFSCLDRFDWTGTGLISIYEIITSCLEMCGVHYNSIIKKISTQISQYGSVLTLDEVRVQQENFYDEEGIALTAQEVLEAVLTPFALRMIQKAGSIYVYDLNAIYSEQASPVVWDSDNSVLSADKMYNNVKVTFSPYGDAEMMKGSVKEDKSLTAESGGILIRQDYGRDNYGSLTALEGFRLHYNETLESNMELSGGAKFFQISPIYSASEDNGIIASLKRGDYPVSVDGDSNTVVKQQLIAPSDCGTLANGNVRTATIIKCPRVYLGYTSFRRMDYKLRINLDLLFDVRYNPFEEASDNNDNKQYKSGLKKHDGPYQNMQDWCNYGYVPIKLTLEDENGNALMHYENYKTLESSSYKNLGSWKSGAASWGQAYLCYYDFDDRKSKCGFGGWQTNKQIIGYYRDDLPKKWKSMDDGEFIDLPSQGGYLVLEIGKGIHQFDYEREVKDIYKFVRYVMYRNPAITLCRKNCTEVEIEDIEDSAWLNKSAREELTIDTIIGTCGQTHGVPNAKGQLFDKSHNIYTSFYRAGLTARLERLLIGTAYSQYASRHDVLAGTVKLLPDFGIYSEENTAGKFLMLSELQNLRDSTSEIKMVTIDRDNYQGIEYE